MKSKPNDLTFQFKIQIKGITKPPVWRRIKVPDHFTFERFHHIIQFSFGWGMAHLYQFSLRGYGSYPIIKEIHEDDLEFGSGPLMEASQTLLFEIFKSENQKFTYIYDFGDDWIHQITLEKIFNEKSAVPEILAGKGVCPPEDCGGVWGYENMKQIFLDKTNPEYKSYREWLGLKRGETWDPNYFNINEIKELFTEYFFDPEKIQPYINQLVEDLNNVAKNPPAPHFLEASDDDEIIISELALVPYKPISEWTGIPSNAFPEEHTLSEKQCKVVLDAIFRVFDAMNIELVDSAAKLLPTKDLYFILTFSWDNDIQYLPNAGFDLELCHGDPNECPYGPYCDCGDDWDDEEETGSHLFHDKIGGFYTDEGEKIDPESIPTPALCMLCKYFHLDDPMENILCLMNRHDQRKSDTFICGQYKKL